MMKCKCGKECGIRIWCHECEAKAIRHLQYMTAEMEYKRKHLEKKRKRVFANLKIKKCETEEDDSY